MTSLQIKELKHFMNALLLGEQFDTFQVAEATITTFNTFHIDGHIVREFYSPEDEITSDLSLWKDIRPICFQLIKGKRTPVAFRIILQASSSLIETLAASEECEVAANLIQSLTLNIRYEAGKATCVTGTSFTTFLMDKTTDAVWDKYIRQFFEKVGISFDE